MVLTLAATIVVLGVLILVHELGHYLAAIATGVHAPRFSIGFGPRLFGFSRWGTEFVVSAVPLGGYVRLAGMDEEDAPFEGPATEEGLSADQLYRNRSVGVRALILSGGVVMNLLFALLVFSVLPLVIGVPTSPPAVIGHVEAAAMAESPGALADLDLPARVTHVADRPVRNWAHMRESLLIAPSGPTRLRVEDGRTVTLDMSPDLASREALLQRLYPQLTAEIGRVSPGSPADRAGIRPGDEITGFDGTPVLGWADLVERITHGAGRTVPIEVERGGQRVALTLTPNAITMADGDAGWIGVDRAGGRLEVGLAGALGHGVRETVRWTAMTAVALGRVGTGEISPRNMGGPILIGQVSGEAARMGILPLLGFMAILSINLAAFNLLPIPILDGGHLMFLAIEAVRGRPLNVRYRVAALRVGLVVMLLIMGWAILNDLVRAFGA